MGIQQLNVKGGSHRGWFPPWDGTIMHNIVSLLIIIFLLLLPLYSLAGVKGACVTCHTMHNSQNNEWVAESAIPNPALLVTGCIGCHTGQNSWPKPGESKTPYVFSTTSPQYSNTGTEDTSDTLAGGSFYWVSRPGGDSRGHNVYGIAGADQVLGFTPPGGDKALSNQLRCAGSMGCHGDNKFSEQITAVKGSHHYKNHEIWQDGLSLATSYRMLNGIQGLGDRDYEYHPTDLRHNKYFGVDRTVETENADGSISSLCARCHQYFHNGPGKLVPGTTLATGVWLRHPTDFDMSSAISSPEYQLYNFSSTYGNNTYSVISPVATVDDSEVLNKTVFNGQGNDALVMCLSCHRAHGSPYAGSLRWNYKGWPADGYNGCAICHTAKN